MEERNAGAAAPGTPKTPTVLVEVPLDQFDPALIGHAQAEAEAEGVTLDEWGESAIEYFLREAERARGSSRP